MIVKKRVPLRMCISCRSRKSKSELIRLAKNKKNNSMFFDKFVKGLGRGTYICKNDKCIKNIKKSKKFKRILDEEVVERAYLSFKEEVVVSE